jgi:hypothetical protein
MLREGVDRASLRMCPREVSLTEDPHTAVWPKFWFALVAPGEEVLAT